MRNTRQLEILIQQSNRALVWFWFWVAITAAGLFWLIVIGSDTPYDVIAYAVPVLAFVGGLFASVLFMFRYQRYNELQHRLYDEPPDEPLGDSILDFQEQRPATARLQTQTSENQLLRSRYAFEPSDWRLLINALRPNYPRWTRRALDKTRLFPGITAPGEFGKVCEEFERLGVIRGKSYQWRVTREGWKMLHEAANFRVVT